MMLLTPSRKASSPERDGDREVEREGGRESKNRRAQKAARERESEGKKKKN